MDSTALTVLIWGLPKGPLMLCLNFAHPLSSRSATVTFSYRSLTRSSLPLGQLDYGG